MRARPSILAVLVMLAVPSCGRDAAPPPHTEFLLLAGDSTFWVRPEDSHLRVRGSPIQLARIDGKLVEIYVADDDRSFRGALLVGQRIYRRDLVTGDSALVFEDTTIASLARWYAHEHPRDRRLRPEEQIDPQPHIDVLGEVVTVDQHGPFLSYEYRVDGTLEGTSELHEVRRGVVDLRDGTAATLSELFGDTAAARIAADGARRYSVALDSVIASGDARAREAIPALGDVAFDTASFTLLAVGREPAVEFAAVGTGPLAGGIVLPLDPVLAPVPDWWAEVRDALPMLSTDSLVEWWARGAITVEARYDTLTDRARLVIRDSVRSGAWPLASIPAPARRLYWLEGGVDSVTRQALNRAFDEAALYSEDTRTASGSTVPRPVPRVVRAPARPTSFVRRLASAPPRPFSLTRQTFLP